MMKNIKTYTVALAAVAASTLAGCAQPMYVGQDGRWYAAPVAAVPVAPRYVRDTVKVPVVRDMYGRVVAAGERDVNAFTLRRTVDQAGVAVPRGYYTTEWRDAGYFYGNRDVARADGRVLWDGDGVARRVSW